MRLAAVQFDIAWHRKADNWSAMERMLAAAALPPDSLAVLPELADTGFSMEAQPVLAGNSLEAARGVASRLGVSLAAGYAEAAGSPHAPRPYNSASILNGSGQVLGTYRKMHLFSPGREHEHFTPGSSVTVVTLHAGDETWRICPLICYDLRFPELFRLAALAGAEVFVVGANWPSARAHHWRALMIARAIENQAFVVGCNRVGHDPHSEYAGGSLIVGPDGAILAEAGAEACVLQANADRAALLRWRDRFPALRDARRSLIGEAPIGPDPIGSEE